MWAWLRKTQRTARASKGGLLQLRRRSSLSPWNMPQSISAVSPSTSMRNLAPVTVPAAPQKVRQSSAASSRFAVVLIGQHSPPACAASAPAPHSRE